MNYKKSLLLSVLLLRSGLIFSMEIDNSESKNELIKKKIKIDYSNSNWGTLGILPDDIKKEILDYIFNNFNLECIKEVPELVKVYDLKLVNKAFFVFLLKKYYMQFQRIFNFNILEHELFHFLQKNSTTLSDKDLKKIISIIKSGINLDFKHRLNNSTALMIAANNNLKVIVKVLIESGANIDLQENDSYTALMYAARNGNVDIIRLLIEAKCDLNKSESYWNQTALNIACVNNHLGVVKLLVESSANLELKSNQGHTPLINASIENNIDIVKLLIEADANINIETNDGKTAFDLAQNEEIRNIFKEAMNKNKKFKKE